jgi:non-homologous end joining protein Ku
MAAPAASPPRPRDVVNVAEALEGIPTGKPDKEMIVIAQKIIEQKKGEFDREQSPTAMKARCAP